MNLCDGFGELMKDLYLCNYSNKVVFITHNRAHKAEPLNTFAEYKVLCCFQKKNNFCFYKSVAIQAYFKINNVLLVFEMDSYGSH